MQVVDLADHPLYDALSYTRGAHDDAEKVTLGGKVFIVTTNLAAILRRLQHQGCDSSPYIWIDALSINHSQIAERSHQTSLMASVYRQAREVVVGLGDANDTDELGMN